MLAEDCEATRAARLRWAVNVGAWQPCGGAEGPEWRFLTSLLPPVRCCTAASGSGTSVTRCCSPQDAAAKVNKYVHLEDKKRALCR